MYCSITEVFIDSTIRREPALAGRIYGAEGCSGPAGGCRQASRPVRSSICTTWKSQVFLFNNNRNREVRS